MEEGTHSVGGMSNGPPTRYSNGSLEVDAAWFSGSHTQLCRVLLVHHSPETTLFQASGSPFVSG